MTTFEMWVIAGMVVVTFGVRYPVLALVSRVELPPLVKDALKFIPPAVLAAIIMPAVVMPTGTVDLSWGNAYLLAGIASALIAWKSRNLLLTIVAGMTLFVLLNTLT